MLRRHRLVELFLVRSFALDWAEVHEEAENLEHAVSDRIVEKIDQILGYPARDPHGDLIPGKSQCVLETSDQALTSLPQGRNARVSRVEGGGRTLAYLKRLGLMPGAAVTIVRVHPEAGLVDMRVNNRPKRLAVSTLSRIFVAASSHPDTEGQSARIAPVRAERQI
jgi:DtxR family transcriptional regulator, Mn-dependent transcriptional regulator